MSQPWWTAHAPVETVVECAGDRHRVRWHQGRLEALDHDDPEGERTLAALGGSSCACVELLDAWSRHADDLCLLTLASRGPGDVLTQAQRSGGRGNAYGSQLRVAVASHFFPGGGGLGSPGRTTRPMTVLGPQQAPGRAPTAGGWRPSPNSPPAGPVGAEDGRPVAAARWQHVPVGPPGDHGDRRMVRARGGR